MLARRDTDGIPQRTHYEVLAARGRADAIAMLVGPDAPASVDYLRAWLYELHGRSGVGMGGLAPLSHRELEAWARLRGLDVRPHEVDALMRLDAILCAPDPEALTADDAAEPDAPVPTRAWPTKPAPEANR